MNRTIVSLAPLVFAALVTLLAGPTRAQGRPDILWMRGGPVALVGTVAISADGTLVISSEGGQNSITNPQIKVYRLQDGMLLKTFYVCDLKRLYATALSPTQNKVATLSQDSDGSWIKLWSVPDAQLLWKQPVTGIFAGTPNGVLFSGDGTRVFAQITVPVNGSPGTAAFLAGFNVATSDPIGVRQSGITTSPYAIAATPTGIAINNQYTQNGLGSLVSFWDGQMNDVRSWGSNNSGIFVVSPDGASLAMMAITEPHNQEARVFVELRNSQDGSVLAALAPMSRLDSTTHAIALRWPAPGAIYGLATANLVPNINGGIVLGWDVATGAIRTIWSDANGYPSSFDVRPPDAQVGSLVAVGGSRGDTAYSAFRSLLTVFHAEDGTPLTYADAQNVQRPAFGFHDSSVTTTCWSADGLLIATGSKDGRAKIWRAADGVLLSTMRMSLDPNPTINAPVCRVAFSPDGKQLAVCTGLLGFGEPSSAGVMTLWDIHDPENPVRAVSVDGPAWQAVYSSDGSMLASMENPGGVFKLMLRRPTDGSLIRSIVLPGNAEQFPRAGLVFSPDDKNIAYYDSPNMGVCRVSDLAVTQYSGTFGSACCAAYTSDGKGIAFGMRASNPGYGLLMLNASDFSIRWQHGRYDTSGFSGHTSALACDPCSGNMVGDCFFTSGGTTTNNLCFWNTSTGTVTKRYDQEVMLGGETGSVERNGAVNGVAYSPDSRYYVYARHDNGLVIARNPFWSPPALLSITASPSTVAGGATCTGTVALNCLAPIGDAVVTLSSSKPSIAAMPAVATIPVGHKSQTFPVTTFAVASQTTVTLSATYAFPGRPSVTKTKLLTVNPPALATFTLSKTSTVGGGTVTGTVSLSGAPVVDTTVTVSSGNSAATVPANVVVPAGAASATFTITTSAVAANTAVTLTATGGGVTKSATLTVKPPAILSLVLNPASVKGGQGSEGTVSLSGPVAAGTGGLVVILKSSSAAATAAGSVIVPEGAVSATFAISTSTVVAITKATISAAADGVTKSTALTVKP